MNYTHIGFFHLRTTKVCRENFKDMIMKDTYNFVNLESGEYTQDIESSLVKELSEKKEQIVW